MKKSMHHLLDDSRLNLIVEAVDGKVCGRAHDVKRGIEIISSMGKNEGASINITQSKMERRRSKGG